MALLNHVYETGEIGKDVCSKFNTTNSISTFLKQLGWIDVKNKKAKWLLSHPPMKSQVLTLMDYTSAANAGYYISHKERQLGIGQIPFPKPEETPASVEDRFTFDEWIERLKSDPVWEYRITRVPRTSQPEIIL